MYFRENFLMMSEHRLDTNKIGDGGCVTLAEALNVNRTLQTLR